MLKKVIAIGLLALSSQAVQAAPMTINDNYVGGNGSSSDVIGKNSWFNIDKMEVDRVGSTLTVKIFTEFAADSSGLGSYGSVRPSNLTNTSDSGSKGIGFGDLFLSSDGWNPKGPAPYYQDNYDNPGETWEYAVAMEDRWDRDSEVSLVEIDGDTDILLSNSFLSGGIYRKGQEVAVDPGYSAGTESLLTSFKATDTHLLFSIDTSGTALEHADRIGLHYGWTCGNDVIEGEYVSVPEPSILGLMGLGLIGIAAGGLRRKKS